MAIAGLIEMGMTKAEIEAMLGMCLNISTWQAAGEIANRKGRNRNQNGNRAQREK